MKCNPQNTRQTCSSVLALKESQIQQPEVVQIEIQIFTILSEKIPKVKYLFKTSSKSTFFIPNAWNTSKVFFVHYQSSQNFHLNPYRVNFCVPIILYLPELPCYFFTCNPFPMKVPWVLSLRMEWEVEGLVVQLLSQVQLFETPWTAAYQAPLSSTNSRSLLKSCLLSWWCYLTISSSASLFFLLSIFPSMSLFQWIRSSHLVAKVLELQLQHQSFQWIFRGNFL